MQKSGYSFCASAGEGRSDRIMRKQQATREYDSQSRDAQHPDTQHSDMQFAGQAIHWRRIATPRRLTLFFWIYVSQAAAGSVAGFVVPFLYYFGVL
jgi:hypothetical protein